MRRWRRSQRPRRPLRTVNQQRRQQRQAVTGSCRSRKDEGGRARLPRTRSSMSQQDARAGARVRRRRHNAAPDTRGRGDGIALQKADSAHTQTHKHTYKTRREFACVASRGLAENVATLVGEVMGTFLLLDREHHRILRVYIGEVSYQMTTVWFTCLETIHQCYPWAYGSQQFTSVS